MEWPTRISPSVGSAALTFSKKVVVGLNYQHMCAIEALSTRVK